MNILHRVYKIARQRAQNEAALNPPPFPPSSTIIYQDELGWFVVKRRVGDMLTYWHRFQTEHVALYVFRLLISDPYSEVHTLHSSYSISGDVFSDVPYDAR